MNTFSYWDCVNADGTFNRPMICAVAAVKTQAERNLQLVVAVDGPNSPAMRGPLSTAHADRAARAAQIRASGNVPAILPYHRILRRELATVWSQVQIIADKVRRGESRP